MSSPLLWKAFYEHDVDTFRQLLETTVYSAQKYSTRGGGANASAGFGGASALGGNNSVGSPPFGLGTSPVLNLKSRKSAAQATPSVYPFTRADLNSRDSAGLTLLHHVASLTTDDALEFASPLIEHPLIDLHVQDLENGWTGLHRAFYFGNVTIARLMLEREAGGNVGRASGHVQQALGLIKIKDREGNGPLDLYAATIKDRTLRPEADGRQRRGSAGSDEERPAYTRVEDEHGEAIHETIPFTNIDGDQLFTFGSNQNVSLGFGDEDDRQFPERIALRRPEHLIRKFLVEHNGRVERKWAAHDPSYQPPIHPLNPSAWVEDIPWMIRSKPQHVQDVQMAKLSTAVITSDAESNLYMCGHGQGGRLGVGDEQTRFNFVCVEGGALAGKQVASVALGQFHTLALSNTGETFSWGNNRYGQLGYSLPRSAVGDEDPISTLPRQIFGVLKREVVLGIAASRIHSVAHTSTSLYTFGKNEGQLGIVDSDARSLEIQTTPRKVAASLFTSSITSVTAIDRATVCLLENHDVWIFANYGYLKIQLPLEGFSNYFLKQSYLATSYDRLPNHVVKVTGGGDTICALASRGEIFTLSIKERQESQVHASTTNPAKIRSAISQPQRIWSPRKSNMAAKDVGVDADGSIILSTEEGSVWRRTKRATIKDATTPATSEYKPKDFKFSRIPGLTRVLAVRASAYGAYAAIRRDCDVLKTQIVVEEPTLWKDMFSLLPLRHLLSRLPTKVDEDPTLRFWNAKRPPSQEQILKRAIAESADIESDLEAITGLMSDPSQKYDAVIGTTTSKIFIPVHRFVLAGRSKVLRRGFRDLCETSTFTIPDLAVSELDKDGRTVFKFQGLDILTIVDLVLYLYTDQVVEFWQMTRSAPTMAYRYRQIRAELMKVASKLEIVKLEPAVRQMVMPLPCLDADMEIAFGDPALFHDGDVVVQLENDEEFRVHSAFVCARCPFFEGLFMGRAGGRWLADRGSDADIHVDLSHISRATFTMLLRHLYADTGLELFDHIVSVGVDDFIDAVMDVMSAANELMLERLSQICQSVVGRFVNVRNACGLLNAISPSSVHEFKDTGLEYLCLSLEAMLQGHYLNELDEDLLAELDRVVRENQLACMPFAKSGRAELLLHERHPELADIVGRNRQAKIDSAALRNKYHNMQSFAPGSVDDDSPLASGTPRSRRRSSATSRPSLKPKASSKDMMFAMDEESDSEAPSATPSPAIRPMHSPRGLEPTQSPSEDVWFDSRGKVLPSPRLGPQRSSVSGPATPRTPRSPPMAGKTPPSSGVPWNMTPVSGPRSDMRNIMAQAASNRTSSLSQGLAAAQSTSPEALGAFSLGAPRMSQKERKRMQHVQQSPMQTAQAGLRVPDQLSLDGSRSSNPWQTVSSGKIPTLREVLSAPTADPIIAKASSSNKPGPTHLTMRQTVANSKSLQPGNPTTTGKGPGSLPRSRPSADASSARNQVTRSVSAQLPQPSQPFNTKPIPQSIRHQPMVEPVLGLSMSEILEQQELEKAIIKEATAKRDLQEIQAEQEFQEWWEKESARVQEAERSTVAAAVAASKGGKRLKGRGGGGGGGRGGGSHRQGRRAKGQGGHDGKSTNGHANATASASANASSGVNTT